MSQTKEFRFETSVTARSAAPPEVVYDVVADLRSHLDYLGERAETPTYRLLTLESATGPASVGASFTSTGANGNGTFHDVSVVTEATRPARFEFETDSRLERTRGRTWEVHFRHRYDIEADGTGSTIRYTDTVTRVNYVPYWLHPLMRPLTRRYIDRADTKQMGNLARLAEERAGM